ncbi:MAG: hypothetical protein ACRCXZ_05630 [Patescibacteria group bacterium]
MQRPAKQTIVSVPRELYLVLGKVGMYTGHQEYLTDEKPLPISGCDRSLPSFIKVKTDYLPLSKELYLGFVWICEFISPAMANYRSTGRRAKFPAYQLYVADFEVPEKLSFHRDVPEELKAALLPFIEQLFDQVEDEGQFYDESNIPITRAEYIQSQLRLKK